MIADPDRFRLDAKTVTAGILLPAVCFAVDYAIGQRISGDASAGFLALYILGCTALILPSALDPRSRVWSIVAGVLAAAALAVCVIALPISLLGGLAAAGSVESLLLGSAHGSMPILITLLSLLGLGTLWTAWVFAGRAYVVMRAGLSARGLRQSLGLGVLGAGLLTATVYGANQLDRWSVTSQVRQISKANLDDWPKILTRLTAYPLCGRNRCARHVCKQLFVEFPGRDGFAFPDEVAATQISMLDRFFDGPALSRCGWLASDGD